MSHKLDQFKFKLEKIIGIQKHAGKVRKRILIIFFLSYFQVHISEQQGPHGEDVYDITFTEI